MSAKTKRPPKGWIRHCIAHVKKRGKQGVRSAGAICGAVWKKMKPAARRLAKKRHPASGTAHRKGK